MTASQSPLSPATLSSTAVSERRADPSMEEILASIRKIIAEEDTPPQRPAPAPSRARELEEQRLTAIVTPITNVATARPATPQSFGLARPAPAAPSPPKESAPQKESAPPKDATPVAREAAPAPAPRVEPVVEARPAPEPVAASAPAPAPAPAVIVEEREPADAGPLVSAAATESIASAFQALTTSVALTNSDTIDRHVRELLRPMLRTWLDDNLPVIVEKLVRIEIERVARGGR